MTLSVAVVSWNVRDCLRGCLASVLRDGRDIPGMEVIVVDNDSRDGTASMLRREYPGVTVVANAENAGFARACNQAYRLSRGRYVLFLNPDTEVLPGALPALVGFMNSHPECGLAGPKVLEENGVDIQRSCVTAMPTLFVELAALLNLRRLLDRCRAFRRLLRPAVAWDRGQEVPSLSGCCLLARREAAVQVGPMDERFHMYGEDLDWCLRIKARGWKVWYLPEARIVHAWDRSASQVPLAMRREHLRSHYLLYRKHRGLAYAVAYRLTVCLASLAWAAVFAGKPAAFRWHRVGILWSLGADPGGRR